MNEKILEVLEALAGLGWDVKGIDLTALWGSGPMKKMDADFTIRVMVPGKPEAK